MRPVFVIARALTRALALIAGLGVVVMMAHICADVVARNVLAVSIPGTSEIVARYYMVAVAFLPLAFLERERAMIAVELIDRALPPRVLLLSDIAVGLLTTAVYATLTWVTYRTAASNYASGTFVDVLGARWPVWPSYFLPVAGFALGTVLALLRMVEAALPSVGRRP